MRNGLVLCLVLLSGAVAAAQPQTAPVTPPLTPPSLATVVNATPTSDTYAFTYFNRPIIVLKANVLGRTPTERGQGAQRALDELVSQQITGPVSSQPFDGGAFISVGPRAVLALTLADIDSLSGETIQGVSGQVVAHLQQALNEAGEARTPRALLRSAGLASAALVVGVA
ncbi:MAG: hypothetical protein ND807_18075, partial [Vicinamibacterales bacterium]|nr:hypothetical protein [Vicinamibacterales bacterium]